VVEVISARVVAQEARRRLGRLSQPNAASFEQPQIGSSEAPASCDGLLPILFGR
jgi:hypothetical protein